MTNAMPYPTSPRSLARISPTQFAGLFSGEDAAEPPARPHGHGLVRATVDLLTDSARTLIDSSQMRENSQVFAKRAT